MDKFKEFIKQHYLNLIIAMIIAVSLLIKDTIIEKYLSPIIQADLKAQGYINEKIKDGKFILVPEKSFADNYELPVAQTKKLIAGDFIDTNQHQELRDRIENLEKQQDLLSTRNSVLSETLKSLTSKSVPIKLFIGGSNDNDGYIVANIHNPVFEALLLNGQKYTVHGSNGESRSLTLRLQIATDPNHDRSAALGNIHPDDFRRLFPNKPGGSQTATIELP